MDLKKVAPPLLSNIGTTHGKPPKRPNVVRDVSSCFGGPPGDLIEDDPIYWDAKHIYLAH